MMAKPTIDEVLVAVNEMRVFQRDYFRTRNPRILEKARASEKRVDQILDEFRKPTLFDKQDVET